MSTFPAKRQQMQLRMITMVDLINKRFPKREYLLHPWLRQGESAMVWAQSGLGKTMATLTMALAVAGGGKFLNWSNETPRKVLIVDGEMHIEDLQARLKLLEPAVEGIDSNAAGRNITVLSRQYQHGGVKFPDIATEDGQEVVRQAITKCGAELVLLDNFSTLCEVADENEASAMTPVLTFLLSLKQQGTACILVHHSGKTGASYRGSSKLATTFEAILGLQPWDGMGPERGTAFEMVWTKFRGQPHAGVTAAMVRLEDTAGAVRWVAQASAGWPRLLMRTALRCSWGLC